MTEMRTFRLDKLVRDKIVEGHEAIGGEVEYEVLGGTVRLEAGLDKIQEELDEARAKLRQTGEIGPDELSDIIEATEGINTAEGRSPTELHAHAYDKRRKVGGFTAWHFVHTVTVPADSELAAYYAANPSKSPEVK